VLTRRILLVCLVLVGTFVSAAPARAAAADLTTDQARAYVLEKINTARHNLGLSPVQVDPRVQDVAQARSDDMATNHYFGHLTNSQLAAMFNSKGISWTKIGEILGENDYPALQNSADVVMQGWRNSSTHWSIITDGAYGFAGVGIAKDTESGDWIWTVEFAKEGAAFVPPGAAFTNATLVSYDGTHNKATVTWSGTPGTYAIKDYRLQYRLNGGAWQTLLTATTATSTWILVGKGKKVEFRIRARDVHLNVGAWSRSSPLTLAAVSPLTPR
jgi:uncharacterized protein YkwD